MHNVRAFGLAHSPCPHQLQRARLIGEGEGNQWEDLDEEVSVERLLASKASAESQSSLKKWLQDRESRTA